MRPLSTIRAAMTALAVALIAAPVAHASSLYGPAMSAAQIRSLQGQGVREIVVDRKPGVSAAQQASLRARAGVSYVGPGPLPGTEIDRAPVGGLAAAVAALGHDSDVRYAEPNGAVHAASVPNDPGFGEQWGLSNTGQSVLGTSGTPGDDIGALYAWQHSTGVNVTVAEVDSGVDYTAPDLQGQFTGGWDYINANNNPQDQFGHGTHVAGIIAALQNNGVGVSGVAPAAKIMPLRVLDQNGSGSDVDVATAFNDAGNDGIPIVNASLGSTAPSQVIEQAIQTHPNTLYVVAAGNNGTNNDDSSTPFYPCDAPEANVICVGASDQNDQPAWFSNYGASSVDLFAPGVNILSTYPGGYAYDDGTSMATPMVSGTLALMLSHAPALTAAQLKSDLLASVDASPQLAGLAVSGGELDAAAAVATAGGDAPYSAPANRELPEVSGALTVGSTLSANPGSWSRLPTSYSYQWQRCVLGGCLPIAGATGTSYALAGSDYGATFEVTVTAGNGAGSAQASSAITAAVGLPGAAPPPVSQPAAAPPVSTTPPAAALTTPTHATLAPAQPLRLTHVALVGKRGTARGQALVFTLSARARVQIRFARAGRGALGLALSAGRGPHRYLLSSLLRGRRLARGRYVLTVRAGSHTATLKFTV